jgi:signal-transduction protein with cAMP-binding, CBS, and nucleotidyltransferase domain
MGIERTLEESFLFGEFPSEEIRRLSQICSTRRLAKGEVVFEEGDSGDSLFLVEGGEIRIFRVLSETQDETLAVLGPGGVFGEMSFVDRVPRSSAAVAVSSSEIVEFSRSDFDVILAKHPLLAGKVIREIAGIMATRIRATDDRLCEAGKWLQEILRWSEWSTDKLPRKAVRIEIAVRGLDPSEGRLLAIAQNAAGHAYLWEESDGRVNWTPAHALYYLRTRQGEGAAGCAANLGRNPAEGFHGG